jgi:hypothetical protein
LEGYATFNVWTMAWSQRLRTINLASRSCHDRSCRGKRETKSGKYGFLT